MIGSITPLIRGASVGRRQWGGAILAYATGSLLTSTIAGALLGAVGRLAGGPWYWNRPALIALSFMLALVEATPRPNRLAMSLALTWRQTSKLWRMRHGPIKAAFLWGADLGSGITTRVNFTSYWLLLIACFALAHPMTGMFLMGGYGIGRVIELSTGPFVDRIADGASDVAPGQALIRGEGSWHYVHAGILCAAGLALMI